MTIPHFFTIPPEVRFSALWTAIAALWALAYLVGFRTASSGSLVLWVLGVLMAQAALANGRPKKQTLDPYIGWVLLAAGFMAGLLIPHLPSGCALLLAYLAAVGYCNGVIMVGKLLISGIFFAVVLPSQSFFMVLISSPLSQICAWLTVHLLQICGVAAEADGAIIRLGSESIAVTAACSGIELLEVSMLLGWIIVYRRYRAFWPRIGHYLTLLPIIICCNTLRLFLVLLLYLKIGDKVFGDIPHTLFGLMVVILTICLLLLAGTLFEPATAEGSKS